MVLYCNFTSLAFLGLLGFLRRQLKTKFIATLLRAAKVGAATAGRAAAAAAAARTAGAAGALRERFGFGVSGFRSVVFCSFLKLLILFGYYVFFFWGGGSVVLLF